VPGCEAGVCIATHIPDNTDGQCVPGCPDAFAGQVATNGGFVGLGPAASCTVLETDGGTVSLSHGAPTGIGGDVCIPSDGKLQISGGQVVTGKVRLETGAQFHESSSASFTVVDEGATGLDDEIAACQDLSAAAAAKTCPPGTAIAKLKNQTITGVCGENVYCVQDVDVQTSDVVTIELGAACPAATFIFNVTGKFVIHGGNVGGKIVAGANVEPSQILYNVIGTGPDVAFSGGGGGVDCCKASVDGTIIAEDRKVNLAPGKVNGVICSEKSIAIVSGSIVCPVVFP